MTVQDRAEDAPIDHVIPGFSGTLLDPGDSDYEATRTVWNAMYDRRPALIARCRSTADVAAAIAYARSQELPIAIRCGGHSFPGYGSCDGGLVIDLREMNRVEVDADRRRARIGGGALLGDVDRATQEHGLVVPSGVVSHTGAGGLILGGGVGRLMRRYGLTVDSLLSVELVTAEGESVHADAEENADLFWALRGGGGNFGVVTEFEFELHEVGDITVLGMFHPMEQAPRLLQQAQEILETASDQLWWVTMLRRAQPFPWMPADSVGELGAVSLLEWSGDQAEGARVLADLRERLAPVADSIDVLPFLTLQSIIDADYGPGQRNYIKGGFFDSLTPEVIAALVDSAAKEPKSDFSQIEVISTGGAISRVSQDATPYPHRDADWLINIPASWLDQSDDEAEICWTCGVHARLDPLMTGGGYVNLMEDEDGSKRSAYGETLERLRRVKSAWDPENVFRINQNIDPAAASAADNA